MDLAEAHQAHELGWLFPWSSDWPLDVAILMYRGGVLDDVVNIKGSKYIYDSNRGILFLMLGLFPPLILIFTRPGFAQSFGCDFAGSNRVSNLNLPHAATISRAIGFSTASSLPTLLPSALVLFASKYIGYMHWKSLYLESSSVV